MYLDWIAAFFGFLGMYFLSTKNKYGFICHTVMSILWAIVGFQTEAYGLVVSSVVFIFLNIGCFWKWKKSEQTKIKK